MSLFFLFFCFLAVVRLVVRSFVPFIFLHRICSEASHVNPFDIQIFHFTIFFLSLCALRSILHCSRVFELCVCTACIQPTAAPTHRRAHNFIDALQTDYYVMWLVRSMFSHCCRWKASTREPCTHRVNMFLCHYLLSLVYDSKGKHKQL